MSHTREQLEAMAAFWDCRQSERLYHRTIAECLTDYYDMFLYPNMTTGQVELVIQGAGPVKVDCYVSNQWSDVKRNWYATAIRDQLFELFDEDEDFAHPDDSVRDLLGLDHKNAILQQVRAAVDELALHAPIWGCSRVGSVTIDADEAVAMMRAANPRWFENAAIQQDSGTVTAAPAVATQVFDCGAAGPTRTGDLLITNQSERSGESSQEQALSEKQARACTVEKGELDQGCGQTLQQPAETLEGWSLRMAALESGQEVRAGSAAQAAGVTHG